MKFSLKSITNSQIFEKFARLSFDESDINHSGELDYKELYIALLLLYDKLNTFLPVHMKVPSKAEVQEYMTRFDRNQSSKLEFDEYLKLCKVLFGDKKSWKDSIILKAGTMIVLNIVLWPLVGWGAKRGLVSIGLPIVSKVPTALITTAAENSFKYTKNLIL